MAFAPAQGTGKNPIKLRELTADPASQSNVGFGYSKDVAGVTELHWENDVPNVVQITSGAGIMGLITSPLDIVNSDSYKARLEHDASENLNIYLTTAAPGALTAALAGAGAGNVDNGAHRYKVTFITAAGETEAGTASGIVTVADKTVNGQVSLTVIPTGNTGIVTQRKVYRTAAGGSVYKLLTTIADNTTTTYTDNTADSGLGANAPSANTALDQWAKYSNDGQYQFRNGSATLPAYTFSSDPNSGLYRVGADSVGITTGGTVRLTIDNTNTTIAGNLIVQGTTTTVNSTVVDIADRVVHYNNSTGVTAVPALAAGFSIHRGATAGPVDRDHAGIFWTNDSDVVDPSGGTGLFRASANTGGDDSTIGGDLPFQASVLRAGDGLATAPSITFGSDLDTGMWSGGANTIAWSVGGSEAARFAGLNKHYLHGSTNDLAFHYINQPVSASLTPVGFRFDGGAHTTCSAGAEVLDVNINLNRTVQFATGAVATQRAMLIQAPTYSFVGASTITDAATFAISGSPAPGANATIDNPYSLWVQGGIVRLDNNIRFGAGTAIVAASYSIGRDADGTNQAHWNVPTGATFELSVNDVPEMTLSATAVNFQNNSLTTTGGGSLTGTWTDLGTVTTIDINGGSIDGAIIGGAAAAAGTFTTLTATSVVNGLGLVGTPSYTFTGDLNTGMWSPTADALAWSTGGSERARITNDPVFLIGKTVAGDTQAALEAQKNANAATHIAAYNTTDGTGASTGFITFQGTGATLVRAHLQAASPSYTTSGIEVAGSVFFYATGAGATALNVGTASAIPLTFWTNNAENGRILSGGELVWGRTTTNSSVATFQKDQNDTSSLHCKNATDGTAAAASILAVEGATSNVQVRVQAFSTSYTTAGWETAGAAAVVSAGAGITQFNLGTTGAHPLTFWTNNAERIRITTDPVLLFGATSATAANYVAEFHKNQNAQTGLVLSNTTNGTAASVYEFLNIGSAGTAVSGRIGTFSTSFTSGGIEVAGAVAFYGAGAGLVQVNVGTATATPLTFWTNGVEVSRFLSGSNTLQGNAGLTIQGGAAASNALTLSSTSHGTKGAVNVGDANGSVGFFGVAATTRATAYTQTYATADKTHANFTSADIGAFTGGVVGFLDAAERDNIRTQFNALRVDVDDIKQLVNSIIDDLQLYGLLS